MAALEYDDFGVTFRTWGTKQRASWRWVSAYADECYLCVDAITPKVETHLDAARLGDALAHL